MTINADGILLVDKESGWSSFDVVAKIRNQLQAEYQAKFAEKRKIKVGHTGTLDPLATGLMIVVVGSYCKRASEFSKLDKTYEAQMKLGETSSTGDDEGEKTKVSSVIPSKEEIRHVLQSFIGESNQIPPAFSAIKVGGQRAYKLAREGKNVEIEPRKVTIHSLKMMSYDYPYLDFIVDVSSGTYIRSLVEDIGKNLGTGAYLYKLRRTKVGKYELTGAINVESVSLGKLVKE